MQYTLRNIPDYLDAALRRAAREQGKSLNEVAVETMVRGASLGDQRSSGAI
jgi:plasmid stability protein